MCILTDFGVCGEIIECCRLLYTGLEGIMFARTVSNEEFLPALELQIPHTHLKCLV